MLAFSNLIIDWGQASSQSFDYTKVFSLPSTLKSLRLEYIDLVLKVLLTINVKVTKLRSHQALPALGLACIDTLMLGIKLKTQAKYLTYQPSSLCRYTALEFGLPVTKGLLYTVKIAH